MKNRRSTFHSVVGLVLGATFLSAPIAMAAGKKPKLNAEDMRFIQTETATGAALVKMAGIGVNQSQLPAVKSFAGVFVAEQSKSNANLSALAANKGAGPSAKPEVTAADSQWNPETTTPSTFDQEFLSTVIIGHERCITRLEKAATGTQDIDLKAWGVAALPTFQARLAEAEKLRATLIATEKSKTAQSTAPDNTARNERDRDGATLTPLDQGQGKPDIDRTAQIRREIIAVKDLSVNAQNVKIITYNGHVTLRGPVDSADERRIIGDIVTRIATPEHTDNQLEVVETVVR